MRTFPVLFGALALLLAACGGPSPADVCQDAADQCNATNEAVALCTEQLERFEKLAEDAGCSGEFDDLLSCSADNVSCTGESGDACASETDALNDCAKATAGD